MTLVDEWAKFVMGLAHTPELIVAGVQRIHRDVTWKLDPAVFLDGSMTLKSTGYTENKLTALRRNYINRESLDRARKDLAWRIENKKYGSGGWNFNGEIKRGTKQDFCIRAGVISYYPQRRATSLAVYWRTAELIKRFRADLIFLRDVILPQFDLSEAPLESVTFSFANSTWHPMMSILLIAHVPRWRDHFNRVELENPRLFQSICYWGWRYSRDKSESIDSYSSARQVRIIANRVTPKKIMSEFQDYLDQKILYNLKVYPDSVKSHYRG